MKWLTRWEVHWRDSAHIEGPRRAGDCASLVSGSGLAEHDLEWKQRYGSLREIVKHAFNWENIEQIQISIGMSCRMCKLIL